MNGGKCGTWPSAEGWKCGTLCAEGAELLEMPGGRCEREQNFRVCGSREQKWWKIGKSGDENVESGEIVGR